MKKKLLSILLIFCILLGVGMLPVYASPSVENGDFLYEPVQVQDLTGARFPGMNAFDWYDDRVVYTVNGAVGVMDVFGNTVLPPVYQGIWSIWNGYHSVMQNDKSALFYKEKQLTPFRYTDIERMKLCFRAGLNDVYEFLDDSGKIIPVPSVAKEDWVIIDIIPYKAILLYQAPKYWYDEDSFDGIVHTSAHYQVLAWDGSIIKNVTSHKIQFRDENSFVMTGNFDDKITYLDGNKPSNTCPDGFYHMMWGSENMGYAYYILTNGEQCYLYDTDYNELCLLETYENSFKPVIHISEELFYVRRNREESVLMNAKGEEVKQLPGYFATFVGPEACIQIDTPTDRFIVSDGQSSYIYDSEGNQIALLEGATACENEGYYITADLGKEKCALYDVDGTFLFDYSSSSASGITIRNGVILHESGNRTAVLNRKGEPITEYKFGLCQNMSTFGLIYVTIRGQEGFFLVNHAGQVLNTEGFDEPPNDHGSYCDYKIDGKMGILRIVKPGDDLFMDVPADTWYHDSVEACAECGLFNGTAPARFSPEETMTRAMLVTVLWRLDGEKSPEKAADFIDVPAGIWYADAVAWASENGIVNGIGKGKFDPEGSVTREQIATILRRYADSKGIDTAKQADLSAYPDEGDVSSYAKEAMAWANAVGLIKGNKVGGTVFLQPKGNATRAQVAAILMRYVEKLSEV